MLLLVDSTGRIREATIGTFYGDGHRVPALLAGAELLAVGEVAGWTLLEATPGERKRLRDAGCDLVAREWPGA